MHDDTRIRCLPALRSILVQESELAGVVERGAALFDSPSLDSLALVNLVVALENEFAIQIDAEDLEQVFATLDSLVDYLDGKRAG
ncbi:acyl carrier protein [Parasulfuritortus cantonensis]|uniref:Acyl carrier protein n=1 Tax=Parasulfuritortus cantonensis TaxID=2528202 RepID=A0A4R1BGI2_9PROT|nr:acyl carrier protein [Parasulfuritortus cantonensis]TCJ16267.1 acyl carrier protein [Parasulfuritortus cantonensis]